ncbi:MAG: GIY-YIG nuclease family protein [Saprospiraceae bacterium]
MYYTYILLSEPVPPQAGTIKKYYVGSTSNPDDRLIRHNRGEVNFTSKGIPWVLICIEEYRTREEALQQEKKIKGRGAGRYLSTRETGFKPSA